MKKLICLVLALAVLMGAVCANAEGIKLVAHYDFEDAEDLGKDVSGNGNDLIKKGKGTLSITDEAAVGAGALELDGETVLVTEETVGDFTDALESYTISFYAKHLGFAGEHTRVFSTGYNGCQSGICQLVAKFTYNGSDHLIYSPIVGDPERDFWGRMDSTNTVLEGIKDYHWYVCSLDAMTNTMTAWIDGELRGSIDCPCPTVNCDPYGAAIGGSYVPWDDNVMYGFIGLIDDLMIYDGAIADLSELEGIG